MPERLADRVLLALKKQMGRWIHMTSVPETRTHDWDDYVPVNQLQTLMTFLTGTLGFVLVSLLLWAVLHIVTRA
jgi:uncharacterized membrane protein